ncbi:Wzz/FepE/Etk N-terminal domain-containing protein [Paenibacillus sp. V4I3]|uniref:Wzz/FepE/Etk N-terminal domain-containing protein n=1 Tax=Paenibacillus sp. V4I3 TaxID=3042305 RepID=UPI0035945864
MREILEAFWSGKRIISVITILSILIGVVFTFFMQPTIYETTAMVRINDNNRITKKKIIILKQSIPLMNPLRQM